MIAIYARYSSDLQNDRSIEDQIEVCRNFIRQKSIEGGIKLFEDRALSGTDTARPSLQRLLQSVEHGLVTIIIAESIDRLSRDLEQIAQIYKLTDYHKIPIMTIHEGTISRIHIGLNGTMSALQLEQIASRTRRGQAGNIRAGKAAGGLPYGYKVKPLNDDGVLESGLRKIDLDEAEVVKYIYRRYLDGATISAIRNELNKENIPSPRGGYWTTVTISGHHGRHNGILQNPIYKGLLIWNRSNFAKHPITGVRHVRFNDLEEWVTKYVKDLQIIPSEEWDCVQDMRAAKRQDYNRIKIHEAYPIILLCGACGGKITRSDPNYLICGSASRHGTCNSRKIKITTLDRDLFAIIRKDPKTIFEHWKSELVQKREYVGAKKKTLMREIGTKQAKLDEAINVIWDDLSAATAFQDKIAKEEKILRSLREELKSLPDLQRPNELDYKNFLKIIRKDENIHDILHSFTITHAGGKLVINDIQPDWQKLKINSGC